MKKGNKQVKKNKKLDINSFFELPLKERLKIMNEIADQANKDQQKLVEKYNQRFAVCGAN